MYRSKKCIFCRTSDEYSLIKGEPTLWMMYTLSLTCGASLCSHALIVIINNHFKSQPAAYHRHSTDLWQSETFLANPHLFLWQNMTTLLQNRSCTPCSYLRGSVPPDTNANFPRIEPLLAFYPLLF